MANLVESPIPELSDRRKLPNNVLLQKFTVLSEGNEQERINATKFILHHLSTELSHTKEARKQGMSDDVKYSVGRLVSGLSSGRKFSRLGFSTTLCQILKTIQSIDSTYVMDCMEEKAKRLLMGRPLKSVIGNVLLGKVFCLLALIHSKRLFRDGGKAVSRVVKQFLALAKEKTYLQHLCMTGVAQVIAEVSDEVFKSGVLPHITAQFNAGWGECTPDTLLPILYAHKYHPKVVKKLVKEHWLDEQLVSEKNFPKLADIVLRSSYNHPIIHCIIDELLTCVRERGLDVVKFWKHACHPLVEVVKGHLVSKTVLALYLFEQLLPLIDTHEKMAQILYPDIVKILVSYPPKKGEDVHITERVSSTINTLKAHTTASKDVQLQLTVLQCLMKSPGSCLFDMNSRTDLLSCIISQLVPEASTSFQEELVKALMLKPSWIIPEEVEHLKPYLQWCFKELTSFVTNDKTDVSSQLRILQFVFLHGFFVVKAENKDIPNCQVLSKEMPAMFRKSAAEIFFKTLSKLVTMNPKGQSRIVHFNKHLDLMYKLVTYVHKLLGATDSVQIDGTASSKELLKVWDKLMDVLAALDKKRKSEERIVDCHAFELLFIYTGLHLFEDVENMQESLEDLHVCYKKSMKRRKSLAKDDGPAWIEVITELLLSMMFKGEALSRNVAKVVMAALADHVTPPAIQMVVDALQQTSLDSEDGMVGMEEDDDDDENMEDGDDENDKTRLDDDDGDSEDSDADSSSDDDESDDDKSDDSGIEEEENVNIADNLKVKVKSALGDAADDDKESDDEEEDAVEFSDSEMFKLDDVLAAAFRSMKKGKRMDKNKTKQLVTFKTRVLDLVEVLIKQHPTQTLLKSIMLPLLDRIEGGKRKAVEEDLGVKAHSTFNMLCKVKKMESDVELDKDELLELLRTLVKYTAKVPVPSMVENVSKACMQVIRMITDHSNVSPLKTRSKSDRKQQGVGYEKQVITMVKTAMFEMLHHSAGHCPPALFHALLSKFPVLFWPLTVDLTNAACLSTDIKVYPKTQASSILADMINNQVVSELGEEDWVKFCNTWSTSVGKVFHQLEAGNVKKMYVQELLAVCLKIQQASPDIKVLNEAQLQALMSQKSKLTQEGKSYLNKLLGNSSRKEKKKKNKKRKNEDDLENDIHSPSKLSKTVKDQSVANGNTGIDQSQADEVDAMEIKEPKGHEVTESTEITPKKHKKKKRKSKGLDESVNEVNSKHMEVITNKNSEKDVSVAAVDDNELNNSFVNCSDLNETVGNITDGELNKSKSKKKKNKKRKSLEKSERALEPELEEGKSVTVQDGEENTKAKKLKKQSTSVVDETESNGIKDDTDNDATVLHDKQESVKQFSPRKTRSKKRK